MATTTGLTINALVIVHIVCASVMATLLLTTGVGVVILYRRSRHTPTRAVARYGMMMVILLFVLTQGYLMMAAAAMGNTVIVSSSSPSSTTTTSMMMVGAVDQLDMWRYATYGAASLLLSRLLASLMGMHKQLRKVLIYGLLYVYVTLTVAVSVSQVIVQMLSYGSALVAFHALSFLVFRWTSWNKAPRVVVGTFIALYLCVVAHFLLWLGRVLYRLLLVSSSSSTTTSDGADSSAASVSKDGVPTAVLYLVVDMILFVGVPSTLIVFMWYGIRKAIAQERDEIWSSTSNGNSGANDGEDEVVAATSVATTTSSNGHGTGPTLSITRSWSSYDRRRGDIPLRNFLAPPPPPASHAHSKSNPNDDDDELVNNDTNGGDTFDLPDEDGTDAEAMRFLPID